MSASERLRRSLAASARDAADAPPPPASVTTLRREIAARGLDDSECVEKADLEAVLRRDDAASLPVRELKRLIELHGGTVPDAVEKAEFARALRETLKNCPICLDEIGESDDGWPAAAALGEFDAVIVTDASAAQESWHRASAGLPEAFLAMSKRVQDRVRVAMFTAIVAFEARVPVDFDASSFAGAEGLWFAARTNSKPGFEALEKECWTLVSTPAWAAAEVERVPMRDPATGAFIPQSAEVLEAPARALLDAFAAAVGAPLPPHTYLHAQRWGSAFPAPLTHGRDADGRSDATKDVLGTAFDASSTDQFAGLGGGGAGDKDFVDGVESSADNQAIVSSITKLAEALDMATTAEGVETRDQLDLLRRLGCQEAQGYLICEPVPGENFATADAVDAAMRGGAVSGILAYRRTREASVKQSPRRAS